MSYTNETFLNSSYPIALASNKGRIDLMTVPLLDKPWKLLLPRGRAGMRAVAIQAQLQMRVHESRTGRNGAR